MKSEKKAKGKRGSYHHGNLRDHLVATTRSLIQTEGPEHFKVADACRLAGVSTAAPYRHFADRQALLDAVAAAGFNNLHDRTHRSWAQHLKGSVEAVSAIGKAYVSFAGEEPNLFRFMFGLSPTACALHDQHQHTVSAVAHDPHTDHRVQMSATKRAGRECYEVLLEQLAATLQKSAIDESVIEAAFPLWTFVHGLSFLVIDGNLLVNRMPIDLDRKIDRATERLMPETAGQWVCCSADKGMPGVAVSAIFHSSGAVNWFA